MRLFNSSCRRRCLQVSCMALLVALMLASFQLLAQTQGNERAMEHEHPTFLSHDTIDGLSIFYPANRMPRLFKSLQEDD